MGCTARVLRDDLEVQVPVAVMEFGKAQMEYLDNYYRLDAVTHRRDQAPELLLLFCIKREELADVPAGCDDAVPRRYRVRGEKSDGLVGSAQ